MTLPTFLGIGVQRSGTTWLHTMLDNHSDVYMPTQRKEIRFFERYYDRGLDWYATFFPPPQEASNYRAFGEISTQYYDCDECPKRIFNILPEARLIVILRHPVSRSYSHYGFTVQRGNFRGSFEEFLASRSNSLEKGFYSRYLKEYLRYFDRSQILVLLFEEMFTDVGLTKETLGKFLHIPVDKFPSSATQSKVNASSVPSQQSLYSFVVKTGRKLRRHNLESAVDFVKRLGIDGFLSKGSSLPPLDKKLKNQLSLAYLDEFDELEQSLQIDLSRWRNQETAAFWVDAVL